MSFLTGLILGAILGALGLIGAGVALNARGAGRA